MPAECVNHMNKCDNILARLQTFIEKIFLPREKNQLFPTSYANGLCRENGLDNFYEKNYLELSLISNSSSLLTKS